MARSLKKLLAGTVFSLASLLVTPPLASGFGQNKIAYDTFDWQVYQTTHFDLHYYTKEEESLHKVASFAESAYERLSQKFNFQIEKKIPLLFYETHSDFEQNNIDMNFIPEGVGAFAEPAKNRMVLPIDLPDSKLEQLIAHELTHIFEYEILFQGEIRKILLNRPPLWFMEGLASYMAQDEDDRARMVLRDAVVNNLIPRITEVGVGGYFAYRYGHAAFDFMESEYGNDAVRDFVFEFRSELGNSAKKALKKAFNVSPEDFDTRFRRWLQKKYVPDLIQHGEPIDFGERLRLKKGAGAEILSAVPSPSGDLVAAFAVVNNNIDVVLFGLNDRNFLRNLTNGKKYGTEYPIVQFMTTGPLTSRDLAWSFDGDKLAYFARKENGRSLVLLNVINGGLEKLITIEPDQPLAPSFSPDGSSVVFRGMKNGKSDIWQVDLATGEHRNLTNDAAFDASPAISPDGKWLYYSSIDDDRMKIFRLSLLDRAIRERVTRGPGNDEDVSFSSDGEKIFFSSSREKGIYNIYSLDSVNGELLQWTNSVGGCFAPTQISQDDYSSKLLFTSYFRRGFGGYIGKMEKPIKIITQEKEDNTLTNSSAAPFIPEVDVPINPADSKPYKRTSFFLEDAHVYTGLTSDQRFFSETLLSWSDLLGNKRMGCLVQSLSSHTNYRVFYFDLEKRLQKGLTAFSTETFYLTPTVTDNEEINFDRKRIVKETGVNGFSAYPLDRHHRVELNLGYLWRSLDVPLVATNSSGEQVINFEARSDNFPKIQVNFIGDTTEFREFGPYKGRRYELSGDYGSSINGETIRQTTSLDYREYRPVSARSLLAFRLFAAASNGSSPDVFYFGGLDTLRGYNFRERIGTRIAYTNLELRFPLINYVQTPFMSLYDIRGRLFFDIGAAYVAGSDFEFWDSEKHRLKDGLSAYGWGISMNFGGMELHWDFAQRWDLKRDIGGRETTFWIGNKF